MIKQQRIYFISIALFALAILTLGGITRLTESGLSIVAWELFTGIFPPFSDSAWLVEFERYKAYPQYIDYQKNNIEMSLAQFKFIYFVEWLHRLLGRLLGMLVLIGGGWIFWKTKNKVFFKRA